MVIDMLLGSSRVVHFLDTVNDIHTFVFLFAMCQDPNQFIRASALRVLSSIRVPIIVPIMMLAIKEASADMSPYVRKTAAHAIQKLYRYTSHMYCCL